MVQASRILLPLKGNAVDHELVELACQVARGGKAALHVIHVIEVNRTLPLDAELSAEAAHGEEVLNRAETAVGRCSHELDTTLLQARDVGSAIVDEALERRVDLIIMGIVHKKRFPEIDLGKTASYVLKHAPCRVWVCRQALGGGGSGSGPA